MLLEQEPSLSALGPGTPFWHSHTARARVIAFRAGALPQVVQAKGSIQSGLAPVRAGGWNAASIIS